MLSGHTAPWATSRPRSSSSSPLTGQLSRRSHLEWIKVGEQVGGTNADRVRLIVLLSGESQTKLRACCLHVHARPSSGRAFGIATSGHVVMERKAGRAQSRSYEEEFWSKSDFETARLGRAPGDVHM